ncbi:hypothetical protein DM01DRAFT_1336964 [Hesseltinella vesiculosa]|uniref:Ribosome assembly protein 3 n=1 Tax=Hesseltinella vesiculosa TaxID=101127 RepID=A0A1X2GEM4_9FUNG|nr:hypothetical protein DM01DRAFT_1336964 [Hesseltinella vesiculosa]
MANSKKRQAGFKQNHKAKQPKLQQTEDDGLDLAINPTSMDDILDQLVEDATSSNGSQLPLTKAYESASDSDDEDQPAAGQQEPMDQDETSSNSIPTPPQDFRSFYMGQLTAGFGNDLDVLRQEPSLNTSRLNVLIDSLETGISVFDGLEKQIMLTE